MPKKRTDLDFDKHELIIQKDELCTIEWLKKPDLMEYNVKFIHVDGNLIVKGDFGTWTFTRNFNPNGFEKNGVSERYWCEYLSQEHSVFDSKVAEDSIKEKIDLLLENAEQDEDLELHFEEEYQQEEYEFWDSLQMYCEDEIELINQFRTFHPKSLDYEDIPCHKAINGKLLYIFDAFEEVMKRYEIINKNEK